MNNTKHNNSIETLVTERLVLRALEENDAKALLNTIGDRETAWWSDDLRRIILMKQLSILIGVMKAMIYFCMAYSRRVLMTLSAMSK